VLVLDQRFASPGWVDLSAISGGPGTGTNPPGTRLGMTVSGSTLTFNVLDTAGGDKQLLCTINNGHTLATSDCATSWATLPPA
jgi:hypothetical protein